MPPLLPQQFTFSFKSKRLVEHQHCGLTTFHLQLMPENTFVNDVTHLSFPRGSFQGQHCQPSELSHSTHNHSNFSWH